MASISVAVVTYNSENVIEEMLNTLLLSSVNIESSVYVIDNGSTDNTCNIIKDKFPQICLIEQENKGFGGGHNAVLDRLTSTYHAIINPDILLRENTLELLAQFMDDNPDVGLCTPLVLNPDGTHQEVPKREPKYRYLVSRELERFGGPFTKWRDEYTRRKEDLSVPTDVEFCTGCFMFIRTELFKKLGGFDERFFLYCEDADLTKRVLQEARVVYFPDAEAVHRWERGSSHNRKLFFMHVKSMQQYFRKWRKR